MFISVDLLMNNMSWILQFIVRFNIVDSQRDKLVPVVTYVIAMLNGHSLTSLSICLSLSLCGAR